MAAARKKTIFDYLGINKNSIVYYLIVKIFYL